MTSFQDSIVGGFTMPKASEESAEKDFGLGPRLASEEGFAEKIHTPQQLAQTSPYPAGAFVKIESREAYETLARKSFDEYLERTGMTELAGACSRMPKDMQARAGAVDQERAWVIKSLDDRGLYYKAPNAGVTGALREAHRYTHDEAWNLLREQHAENAYEVLHVDSMPKGLQARAERVEDACEKVGSWLIWGRDPGASPSSAQRTQLTADEQIRAATAQVLGGAVFPDGEWAQKKFLDAAKFVENYIRNGRR